MAHKSKAVLIEIMRNNEGRASVFLYYYTANYVGYKHKQTNFTYI